MSHLGCYILDKNIYLMCVLGCCFNVLVIFMGSLSNSNQECSLFTVCVVG